MNEFPDFLYRVCAWCAASLKNASYPAIWRDAQNNIHQSMRIADITRAAVNGYDVQIGNMSTGIIPVTQCMGTDLCVTHAQEAVDAIKRAQEYRYQGMGRR